MAGDIIIVAGKNFFNQLMSGMMGGGKSDRLHDGMGSINRKPHHGPMNLLSGKQGQNSVQDTLKELFDEIKELLEQLLQQFSNQENAGKINSNSSRGNAGIMKSDSSTKVNGSELGSLSAKYETGNRGPGTVSSGVGDAGGVSYGSYQMTSNGGGTVKEFVNQSDFPWRDNFKGLAPGSKAFTAEWKKIAAEHPNEFQKCQHDFIKKTHYDPLSSKIKNECGLDISEHSQALQNVIWSTAVQHGPGSKVVSNAINTLKKNGEYNPEDANFDAKLIKAIYAERGRKDANGTLVHFGNNSAAVQKSVAERFVAEEKDALAMLENEN